MFDFGFGLGLGGGGGGFGAPAVPLTFEVDYRCYPVTFHDKAELEKGDKIVMPQSALDRLFRMNVAYPLLFQLTNQDGNRSTHCGVMEFSAPEGVCYLPYWMMQGLLLAEGSIVHISNVSLKKASFVKFRPHSKDFLDISNPKAVLEKALRTFSCVTEGDQICFPYNNKKYYMDVLKVKPDGKACVIETDCKVDFAPPADYVEPDWKGNAAAAASAKENGSDNASSSANKNVSTSSSSSMNTNGVGVKIDENGKAKKKKKKKEKSIRSAHLPPSPPNGKRFKSFTGSGQRLDGKAIKNPPLPPGGSATAGKNENREAELSAQRRQLQLAAAARRERNAAKRKLAKQKMAVEVQGQGSKLAFGGKGRTLMNG
eukprot:g2424.t1